MLLESNIYFYPEQIRRRLLNLVGDEANAVSIFGANFSAGFVAGTIAAAATCPLDVAKTRRQIEVFSSFCSEFFSLHIIMSCF